MPLAAALLAHVVLSFPPDAVTPPIARAALAEAAIVWEPYRVVVDAGDICEMPADDTVVLTVTIVRGTREARNAPRSAALGALTFDAGAPQPSITLFVDEVTRIVASAGVYGTSELVWPRALRERIIGRVIGRVLAHEIGHYLLQEPGHTATGLMRPLQKAQDLVSPERRRFELAKESEARLDWITSNREGPADAGPSRHAMAKK